MNIRAALKPVLNTVSDVELRFDEPLARHTTFRVGGPARLFARPRTGEGLCALLKGLREEGVRYLVLGGGSNVLAPDGTIDAAVVKLELACRDLSAERSNGDRTVVYAGAGVKLPDLVGYCIENGLRGLEQLAGIPGTVGGALVMNAGTSSRVISDSLVRMELLDEDCRKRVITREELKPAYRSMGIPEGSTVLGGWFGLEACSSGVLRAQADQVLLKRRRTQPLRYPSAGSIFKNPEGMFAGALIEKAGLKGFRLGGAEVSKKHANWVINRDNAKSSDILGLIEKIENEIYETFGVRLEREIRILD